MSNNTAPNQPTQPRWRPDQINEHLRIKLEGQAKIAQSLSPERIILYQCLAKVACVAFLLILLVLRPDLDTEILTVSGTTAAVSGVRKWFAKI